MRDEARLEYQRPARTVQANEYVLDAKQNLLVGGAGDLVNRLVQAPPHGVLALHRDDGVTRLDAAPGGGGTLERVDDHDPATVVVTDENPDTDEVAIDLLLEPTKLLRPDDLRVLVLVLLLESVHRTIAEFTDDHRGVDLHGPVVGEEDLVDQPTAGLPVEGVAIDGVPVAKPALRLLHRTIG